MKFENILMELFQNNIVLEQFNDDDNQTDQEQDNGQEQDNDQETDNQTDQEQDNDQETVNQPDQEQDNDQEVNQETQNDGYTPRQWPEPIRRKIVEWKNENRHITIHEIDDTINFFNGRKNNLRPFQGTLGDPDINNMPEITSFKQRFPEFPSENIQVLKDITQYTWEQLEFLSDRFSNADAVLEIDGELDGITFEERLNSALKIWENFPKSQKIIDQNNVTVIRVESKDDSIILGKLQHLLVGFFGGAKWCITYGGSDSNRTNLYTSYRKDKSFYFILDKNKSLSDVDYLAAIYTEKNIPNEYSITRRSNSPHFESGKSWEDLVYIWPELKGKQSLIVPFGETQKERLSVTLDKINFTIGSRNDLAIQTKQIQKTYVDSGRSIQSTRVFLSLSKELQKIYVAKTTLEDFKTRFICRDTNNPFKLLNTLRQNQSLYKFLDEFVLKTQLGVKNGVFTIKGSILKLNYKPDFTSDDGVLRIFKTNETYGVINIENLQWLKPIEYMREKYTVVFNKGKSFMVFKHIGLYNDDIFYWIIPFDQFKNKKPRGSFYSKEDGEDFLKSSTKM